MEDYHRRPKDRPGLPGESDVRFFQTIAGPDGAAYPSAGQIVYAQLLQDPTFDKSIGAVIDRGTPAEAFAFVGSLSGIPPKGSIVAAKKAGARWWIVEGPPAQATNGAITDPSACIYPGSDLSAHCSVCPCTADPWVFQLPNIICGSASVGGDRALMFNVDDSTDGTCVWESGDFTSDYRTFNWKLTINEDAYGGITAEVQLLEGDTVLATWKAPAFCCWCTNCFNLLCNTYFPPPCATLPRQICVGPPIFGEADDGVDSGLLGCPPCVGAAAFGWAIPFETIFGGDPTCGDKPWPASIQNHTASCRWDLITQMSNSDPSCVLQGFLQIGLGDEFGFVTLTIIGTCLPGGVGGSWTIANADFDCVGPNTLEKVTGDGLPDMVTITPTSILIDSFGTPIRDADGNFILKPDHDSCVPAACSCCFGIVGTEGDSSTYNWVAAEGADLSCETFTCDGVISQLPDPTSQEFGTVICGTVTAGEFTETS